MPDIVIVDSGFLSAGLKVGQTAGTGTEFIDRFVESSRFSGDRLIINDVGLGEFLDVRLPQAELQTRIDWWNQNSQYFELMNVDDPQKYTNNKGEHSIVDDTVRKIATTDGTIDIKIATVDDWLRKPIANSLSDGTYNFDVHTQIIDWGGFYRNEFMLNRLGVVDSFDSFRSALPQSGETGINKSLLTDFKSGVNIYQPESVWSGLDDMRNSLSDLQQNIGNTQYQKFSDIPEISKAFWFAKSIEVVAALTIVADGYFTRQGIISALQQGDRELANELLGGYIGRAFGGAFLGVLTAAAFATLPGMILGGILGAYYGTEFGEALGEWLFGKTASFGFDAVDALDALGDLLRHFRSDPLVLDLDGDGITLTALNTSNTRFDIDGDGAIERVGWVGPNDGLLVLDANQNGQVDGIDELIGNTHVDGFDELTTLDSNGDGKIDQLDASFSNLRIWRDVNGDGISSSSEMLTTDQAGIVSFKLAYTASGIENGGNVIARLGSYTLASGVQRSIASVQFAKDETVTRPTLPNNVELGEIKTLPNLGGYGPMADLRTSMFHDPILKAMVLNLTTQSHDFDTFEDFLEGGLLDILYRWAGVDLHAAGETSASLKEKLIEALTGESLFDLSQGQKNRVDDVFNSIIGKFGVGFLIQAADRPANMLMVDLGADIAGLNPADPNYLDAVANLTESSLSALAQIELPYAYLSKFLSLSLDPATGTVTGDFDAFAREFVKGQPSFEFVSVGTAGPAGGGARPAPPSNSTGFVIGSIAPEVEEPEPEHPWLAWYENQGVLLFNVAAAMGIGAEYVKNVTGWQWLLKLQADVYGTSGNDILSETVSTVEWHQKTATSNGGLLYQPISGTTRDQRLYGFEGDDELRGNDSTDTLIGGVGNDLLLGGSGSDMYIYSAGDGLDRITEESGADDAIFFSKELSLGDLHVIRLTGTNDLQLHFGDASQGIILTNQINMGNFGVERFSFVGVGPLDAGDIATIYLRILSSENGDSITGTRASESIFGLGGNDTLSGWDGDDHIFGDDGDDILKGDNGNDTITGGDGNDAIDGGFGHDVLIGGQGNDRFVENRDDGDDTYIWNLGDGDDVITGGERFDGFNTIQFGAGIAAADLLYAYANGGGGLKISVAGQPGSITMDYQLSADSTAYIDQLIFADGTVLNRAIFEAAALAQLSTSGNDTLWGSGLSETVTGGTGDDFISMRGGNDLVYVDGPNEGYDSIDGGSGIDTVQALSDGTIIGLSSIADVETITAGTQFGVFIQGSANADVLNFGGTTLIGIEKIDGGAGNDTLSGSAGNDVIWGSAGNDILKGNAGDDLFLLAGNDDGIDSVDGGAGNDVIAAQADNMVIGLSSIIAVEAVSANGFANVSIIGSGNADTLNFANVTLSGITNIDGGAGNDVLTGSMGSDTLLGSGGDDVLSGNDGSDVFQYTGNLNGFDTIDGGNGIDIISALVNDTVIGLKTFTNVETISAGSFQNVTIAGSTIANTWNFGTVTLSGIARIDGGLGNDTITGSTGGDILRGSEGDDVLSGGDGDDVFQYIGTSGGFDTIDGGAGTDTLQALANGTTVGLKSINGVESINANGFTGVTIMGSSGADTLNFNTVTLNGIASIDGGVGNDIITGSSGNDVLFGSAGNDSLAGGDGDDLLSGGTGSDVFDGGNGSDTVTYSANTAAQTINLTLTGAQTISSGDIDAIINVENVIGGFGADTITGDTAANVLEGRGGNDTLNGGAGNDTLLGGDGNDTLIGGSDNDSIDGGNGIDTISYAANAVAQTIQLSLTTTQTISAGDIDTIINVENVIGGAGADMITGDGFANSLDGGLGNDRIDGNGGNDTLLGNDGDDLLFGGAGNDVINGGNGIDTIDYSYGTVAQTINLSTAASQTISIGDADTITNVENVIGGSGNDTITGSAADNVLDGGAGDDRLKGGAGNDTIIGGAGTNDVAVFSGTQASYSIATNNGVVTITDNQPSIDGNDGIDTVSGIEKAEFKGGVQVGISAPIVFDLNGDGVTLVDDKRTKANFDWDGDGTKNQTGWIGKDDGFLFIDRDSNGTVTNAGELSFTSDKEGAKSDLDGLRAFDSNEDGLFSSADDQFAQFSVWQDKNGNGQVDKKEILSLQKAGVASIDLVGTTVNQSWEWGENITINTGAFTRTNGTVGSFSDVALSYDTTSSQNAGINKAASQLSEAMAGFWDGLGAAAFGKFEPLAEHGDNFLVGDPGEWR